MPENHVKFHSSNGKRLVLIVEDEQVNRELLAVTLKDDYDLIFANTGAEARDLIRAHFDTLSLVLLDLNLPDVNGLDILRWMKGDARLSRLPVIVLTSDRDSEVESLTLGAMDFIPKPYPMAKVILARVLRTIELCEDRDILRSTERDHLTGLYNQDFFYRYAEQYDVHHKDQAMDAIVIDVNHFHMLNERYGKAYGDEVLCRIGERLRDIVKTSGGIVCRHEADTFFIYCPHRTDYPTMLDQASTELTDQGHRRTHVRLRMGVYSDVDKSIDIERRFDRARMAANTVRSSFTKGIAIYDSALHESELFEEHLLESFHDALKEHQFIVYYQPKFDIRPTDPVLNSAEALVRWNNPDLGMVSPGVFVPLFERNGLIQELDEYVWREVARQIRDWKDRLGFCVPVSVNVSRVDMYDVDFVSNMTGLLEEFGLTTDDMLLEITESAYTENSDQIIEIVTRLREVGFRIEMDDFGSGYSSLNMVSTLPIDALKLDMQFIRNAFNGRRDTRMLEVVLEIADSLMVPSIAEGVETAEQMFTLKSLGCDIVQGFYFSRPVPPQKYEPFLLARREVAAEAALPEESGPQRSQTLIRMEQDFPYETMHDPQTGLYNASAFQLLLEEADRGDNALMLVEVVEDVAEADRDWVALRVAEVLRQSFRSVDFVCRAGVADFAIIMARMKSSLRRQVEEKLAQINWKLSRQNGDQPPVSLRAGVAFTDREAARDSLLADATRALERARDAGEAGCVIYAPEKDGGDSAD